MSLSDPVVLVDQSGTTQEVLPAVTTNNHDRIPESVPGGSKYRLRTNAYPLTRSELTVSHQYGKNRRTLIRLDWRNVFNEGSSPELFAQYPSGVDCSIYAVVQVPADYPAANIGAAIKQFGKALYSGTFVDEVARGEA